MKILEIEWKHLDVDGETCDRCYDTGENLTCEIRRLNRAFAPKGIQILLKETVLDEKQVARSNTILFNGRPLEEILDIQISENYCRSCSDLLKKETYCRTVKYDGEEFEDVPAKAIRHAVYRVLGEGTEEKREAKPSCCCGDHACCG